MARKPTTTTETVLPGPGPDVVLSSLTKLRRVTDAVQISDLAAAHKVMPKIDEAMTEAQAAVAALVGRIEASPDPLAIIRDLRMYRARNDEITERLTQVFCAVFVAAEASGLSLAAIAEASGFSKSYVHRAVTDARTVVG